MLRHHFYKMYFVIYQLVAWYFNYTEHSYATYYPVHSFPLFVCKYILCSAFITFGNRFCSYKCYKFGPESVFIRRFVFNISSTWMSIIKSFGCFYSLRTSEILTIWITTRIAQYSNSWDGNIWVNLSVSWSFYKGIKTHCLLTFWT